MTRLNDYRHCAYGYTDEEKRDIQTEVQAMRDEVVGPWVEDALETLYFQIDEASTDARLNRYRHPAHGKTADELRELKAALNEIRADTPHLWVAAAMETLVAQINEASDGLGDR